ncbi:Uma2 family endonuclease [Flavobacterium sp.]|uniref:Uma2 family endonuclease n=1 Tax=Flavobacterium sp. TaxID=239 RepID=UPI0037538EBA
MGFPELKFITEKEYLKAERLAVDKHEYYKGEIFPLHRIENEKGKIVAMSGASFTHNKIFSNTFGKLSSSLFGKKCAAFGSDLRINIPINSLYTYPDISVICNEPEFTDEVFDTITNPSVIFEILSKSTRNYDLGQKFALYRQITSLKNYVVIDSEKISVLIHTKNEDESWLMQEYNSLDSKIKINILAIEILLNEIYQNVILEVS